MPRRHHDVTHTCLFVHYLPDALDHLGCARSETCARNYTKSEPCCSGCNLALCDASRELRGPGPLPLSDPSLLPDQLFGPSFLRASPGPDHEPARALFSCNSNYDRRDLLYDKYRDCILPTPPERCPWHNERGLVIIRHTRGPVADKARRVHVRYIWTQISFHNCCHFECLFCLGCCNTWGDWQVQTLIFF